MSERARVLTIILLGNLPLVALIVFSVWRGTFEAESRVIEDRIALARAAALAADAFLDGNLSTARTLATLDLVRNPQPLDRAQDLVDRVLQENPEWEGWGIADPEGWNIVSTGTAPRTLFVGDRPYYQEMLATGRPVVSPAVHNRRTGNPTIVLAVPVDLSSGQQGGIIVSLSTLRLKGDLEVLVSAGGPDRLAVAMVDSQGQAFLHPDRTLVESLTSLKGDPAVDAALRKSTGALVRPDGTGTETLVAFAPAEKASWGTLILQPAATAFDLVRRQLAVALVLVGIGGVLAGLIGWYLGGRLAEFVKGERAARAEAEERAQELRVISAESESRRLFLEELISASPAAIAVIEGSELRLVTVSGSFAGLRPDVPLIGRRFDEAFPRAEEQGLTPLLREVLASGEQFVGVDLPYELADERGEPIRRYFTINVKRLESADGAADRLLLVAMETTEQVIARQEIEQEKDAFLSMASHELKTPLTAISLAVQMIDRALNTPAIDTDRFRRHVTALREQVARSTRLIGDLLDVSRIHTGRLDLNVERVNLASLVRAAVERACDTQPPDQPCNIELHVETSDLTIEADEGRLDQVLTNLLSNAVKYGASDGTVDVYLKPSGADIELVVVDHGMGIPPDERERIFRPFNRTAQARQSGIEGTGLGLYISRRIVEAHGGQISVEDTPGGGATFRVRLPQLAGRPVSPDLTPIHRSGV